jgi:RNA polymerase sigma-70 factor (ECF subfamily)
MDELIALIATLPDGARQVFNLSVFEGYSHDEIAALLDIPAGTSRSLLSRARKILQDKIMQQAHELAGI